VSREIRRVPLDFDWPHREVWTGYLMPDHLRPGRCPDCDGAGWSTHAKHLQDLWYGYIPFDPASNGSTPFTADTPAVRAFAERNVTNAPGFYGTAEHATRREAQRLADLWNGQWGHHLNADDVAALLAADRLLDLTHTCTRENGWQRIDPPVVPTPQQVNEWSLRGFGHDSTNCWAAIKARCGREGVDYLCARCGGDPNVWRDGAHKAAYESWTRTDPPTGEGWQLWETVSEGSPISPVFPTADLLAQWIADPERGRDWMPLPAAQQFVRAGWAPTLVMTPETGVVSGTEWVGMSDAKE
jgi:hypothetical protein